MCNAFEARNIKYILFDLDGTISDSAPGIVKSVAYALDKLGVKYESSESLRRFVGPPLREEFMKYCGLGLDDGNRAVDLYREYYTVKGIYENSMYPGIPEMLAILCKKGYTLAVATSKPEKFARDILGRYICPESMKSVVEMFAFVGGSEMNGDRTDKSEVIKYVVKNLGENVTPEECVMVGDREHDILGAKKNGMRSIGVLWGYGGKEELENAGADVIVSSACELSETL